MPLDRGAESVIKPARQADGRAAAFGGADEREISVNGKVMGPLGGVESFFSAETDDGFDTNSRKPSQLDGRSRFKVLAYTLRR